MSYVLHLIEPSLKSFSYIANNYINNTYFICSLATWGKYKGNTQSINLLLFIYTLYKVSYQDLFIYNLF